MVLCSCALPTPDAGTDGFVSKSDLDLISLTRLGQRAYAKGNYYDAESFFDKALAVAPDSSAARLNRAIAIAHSGQMERAEPEFIALIKQYPKIARYWLAYGEALVAVKQYNKGVSFLEQGYAIAVQDKKVAAIAAHNLAQANLEAGYYGEARCWAATSFALDPNSDRAAYGVSILTTIGASKAAFNFGIGALTVLQPAPPSQELLLNISTAAFALGDCDSALSYASRVLDDTVSIDPQTKFGAVVVAELCSPPGDSGTDFQQPLRDLARRTWPAELISAYNQRHDTPNS